MSALLPLVIGHRGFPARFPENSIAGFEAAIGAGADGVETDVRVCADGIWVCHHDLRRRGRRLGAWALRELLAQQVPTVEELLAVVPADRWLYLEIKPLPRAELDRHGASLATALRTRAARTRIISSSPAALQWARETVPEAGRSLVFDRVPVELPDGADLSPKHTLVEALLATGRALHPWTINEADRMRRLAELGVASLTTNRPDLAVEVLRG